MPRDDEAEKAEQIGDAWLKKSEELRREAEASPIDRREKVDKANEMAKGANYMKKLHTKKNKKVD